MRGSEVLKALEEGKKIRVTTWDKSQYIYQCISGVYKSSTGSSWVKLITDLYDYEWAIYTHKEPILSYKEALAQLEVGDKILVVEYSSDKPSEGCSQYTGVITTENSPEFGCGACNKSLLKIKLDMYPTQIWTLPTTCKVQKV